MIIYRDKVNIVVPKVDSNGNQIKDDYGKPVTEKILTKAHVRYNIQNIYNANGEEYTSVTQVYIPISDVVSNIDLNARIEHITPKNTKVLGQVKKHEYGQDITGKPHFIKGYM
ncbi:hypothetical protein [Mammaliicoccus fleurettii]|uniref:hypothetical protein n=1 Tax=Mammaliicoccus fleurettii TaxID=150056 RepID=UPI002DB933A3|nr:hypothetical protein [Mammaliicoccus fleurettii]MEB7723389.1 hypothetical protein [Mammaliicoccus fleurettii]